MLKNKERVIKRKIFAQIEMISADREIFKRVQFRFCHVEELFNHGRIERVLPNMLALVEFDLIQTSSEERVLRVR